eukprot:TRINITY_DN4595_c0_g1_i1.p1 TRINITY_DN4595_c0_g1~~TRINITY_DN4595_c0_g1_i1.p1  ORF type:complete len:395 (-),score=82.81 TRINITY_DN4595_c0_g1_i1:472-1656(-)
MAQEVEKKLGNLFQGGLSMFSMDLKSTGITWVDNVYQKFEAICQEVENIMIQETTKLVENQAQTVGLNVQKFCAEVVQDLIPPSAGSVKVSTSDLSSKHDVIVATCKNSKIGLDNCSVNDKPTPQGNVEIVDSAKMDLSPASLPERPRDEINEACNAQTKNSIPSSVEATEHNSTEKAGENCNNVSDTVACIADVSSQLPFPESVLSVVCCKDEVEERGSVQYSGVLSTEINDNCISQEITSLVGSSGNGHEQHCGPAVLEDFLPPQEIGGRYFDGEKAAEGNAVIERSVETIGEFEDVTVEETRGDAGKNEFCYISIRESKTRSFKKKLRDAVASKMQLAKKQGYEQIAIWYDDVDMETKQGAGTSTSSTFVGNLDPHDVSSPDVCVSDWEFL